MSIVRIFTKIDFHSLVLLALCSMAVAQESNHSVEIRASYFTPTNYRFENIYFGAGLFSVETNIQFLNRPFLWVSLGLLYTSGRSIGQNNKTTLFAIPLNLGIKYPFCWNDVKPYVGIGIASIPFSHIHNHSPYVTRHQNGWGIGGIFKSGLMVNVSECLFLDIFLDYMLLYMHHDHSDKVIIKYQKNLSGISTGLGFGFFF